MSEKPLHEKKISELNLVYDDYGVAGIDEEQLKQWAIAVVNNAIENIFDGCTSWGCGISEVENCPKHKMRRVMSIERFMMLMNVKKEDLND